MSMRTKSFQKGYKFRIYPNKEQEVFLNKTFGCCRYVWNHLLAKSKEQYDEWKNTNQSIKPNVTSYGFINELPIIKSEEDKSWLNEVSSSALQQSVLNLGKAYQKFFKEHKGYPKFKKKHDRQSFILVRRYFKVKDNKFFIAKMEQSIKIKFQRSLPSEPSSCSISKTPSGKYYASFLCEYTPKRVQGERIIGIDAGITSLATLSTGESIENPRYFIKSQKRLKRLQHRLSSKKKGSNNRNKARLKVALCHEHITNQRNDYLHQLTNRLVCENQAIAIEKLMVSNMVRNHKLAKHILDAGWGKLREYLTYKVLETPNGRLFLAHPYYPSTQLCSTCGWKPGNRIKLGVTSWICEHCGTHHDRDENAAINLELLARSQQQKCQDLNIDAQIILTDRYVPYIDSPYRWNNGIEACGDNVQLGVSMKQEISLI